MRRTLLASLALLAAGCQPHLTPKEDAQVPATPDALWASRGCTDDDRGLWFRDAKFGAFIHFGLYSSLGGYYDGKGPYDPAEQIMGLGDRRQVIPWRTYRDKVGGGFNPAKFDAARWVKLMKDAGQKYVILTAKHHDGFCMWKTATTPYNVVEATPFGRDVVKELSEECRRQGLVFCVYYSIGDWTAKDVMNPGFGSYTPYMHAQLKELLTNYGDVRMLWFDNWWYVDNQWKNDDEHAKDLYTFARSVSPRMLVNDRCGAGVKSDHGDYATPENQLKGSLQSRYFEVVMTNTADDNWGWVKGATNYRTADEVIRNLIDSASKGGNFVLNVGPNAEGEFPPEHVALLEEVGRWTRANGEAIYGTRPGGFVEVDAQPGAVVYTTASKDGAATYVHVVSWPSDGSGVKFRVKDIPLVNELPCLVQRLPPTVPAVAELRPGERSHGWMRLQPGRSKDPHATVFKITDR